jgi:hypothetical protein
VPAASSAGHHVADEHRDELDAALEVLLDSELEPIVDMVLTRRDGRYEALAPDGRVAFRRHADGSFEELEVEGRNPLGSQAVDRF